MNNAVSFDTQSWSPHPAKVWYMDDLGRIGPWHLEGKTDQEVWDELAPHAERRARLWNYAQEEVMEQRRAARRVLWNIKK